MIPVLWLNLHPHDCHPKDHWDTSIFQELILAGYDEWNGKPEDFPKAAVVMIAGRFHYQDVEAINRTLGFLDGCVVVIHSDEESLFPWGELEHPNMRRWVMTPAPDTKQTEGVRFIGEGWSPGTPRIVAGLKRERILNVSFMGQITHLRRQELTIGMLNLPGSKARPDGEKFSRNLFLQTHGFAKGFDRTHYLTRMVQTKFAPCPSGPVTADSFRVYEALEAGCVPILDRIDGLGRDASELWHLMLGRHNPLPILGDWRDLPYLIASLLPEWETRSEMTRTWWTGYKAALVKRMSVDVEAVG